MNALAVRRGLQVACLLIAIICMSLAAMLYADATGHRSRPAYVPVVTPSPYPWPSWTPGR